MKRFLEENSYGRQTLSGQVNGWITLNGETSDYCSIITPEGLGLGCDTFAIRNEATQILISQGVNPSNFNRNIYVVSGMQSAGEAGGSVMTLGADSGFNVYSLAHEFGHTLNMGHPASWECGSNHGIFVGPDNPTNPVSGGCVSFIYGNGYDPMNGGLYHYNTHYKEIVGYIESEQTTVAAQGGTSTIDIDASEINSNGIKQIKIPIDDDPQLKYYYFLEYRKPSGFDDTSALPEYASLEFQPVLQESIQIRFKNSRIVYGVSGSINRDVLYLSKSITPQDSVFCDPYRHIKIELLEFIQATNQARVRITYDSDCS